MDYNEWHKCYEKWQLACVEELKKIGYTEVFINLENSENDNIEICEDGRIHFQGNFYLSDKLVTAWEDSEYYQD